MLAVGRRYVLHGAVTVGHGGGADHDGVPSTISPDLMTEIFASGRLDTPAAAIPEDATTLGPSVVDAGRADGI